MTVEEQVYLESMLDTILFGDYEDKPETADETKKRHLKLAGTVGGAGAVATGLATGVIDPARAGLTVKRLLRRGKVNPPPVKDMSSKVQTTDFKLVDKLIEKGSKKLTQKRIDGLKMKVNKKRRPGKPDSKISRAYNDAVNTVTGAKAKQASSLHERRRADWNRATSADAKDPKVSSLTTPHKVKRVSKDGTVYEGHAIKESTVEKGHQTHDAAIREKKAHKARNIAQGVITGTAGAAVGTGGGIVVGKLISDKKHKKNNERRSKALRTRRKNQKKKREQERIASNKTDLSAFTKAQHDLETARVTVHKSLELHRSSGINELSEVLDSALNVTYTPDKDNFEFSRPRNQNGEFAPVESNTNDPAKMKAAYDGTARRDPFRAPIAR